VGWERVRGASGDTEREGRCGLSWLGQRKLVVAGFFRVDGGMRGRLFTGKHQNNRIAVARHRPPLDRDGAPIWQRDHLNVVAPVAPRRQLDVAKDRRDVAVPREDVWDIRSPKQRNSEQ